MKQLFILLAILLTQACVNQSELAKQSLELSLLDANNISFRNLENYPGAVVCGQFSTRRKPSESSYRPFIYRLGIADNRPSKDDISIFCSSKPAMSLYGVTGINLTADQRNIILRIKEDYIQLGTALNQYETDNFILPKSAQGTAALLKPSTIPPTPVRFRKGGYLAKLPLDPWSKAYLYSSSAFAGVKGHYQLLTLGADGEEGGIDENADVSSDQMKYIEHILSL